MNKRYLLFVLFMMYLSVAVAQRPVYAKISPWLRHATRQQASSPHKMRGNKTTRPTVCAFIRLTEENTELLSQYGCKPLAQFGNLYIADIPLHQLSALSNHPQVKRIEAQPSGTLTLDTALTVVQIPEIQHSSTQLPQAYTGKGVIMGVQDVGFDLTHPTFRDTTLQECRIQRFWDQISTDTLTSQLYVGADYTTPEAIAQYAHSRDAQIIQHGCHTAGIAAGSGYNTPYRGVAYESDLCLVSNAVVNDTVLIRKQDLYKYTSATDVLGFKYIFDYAEEQDKPCVISFSEGDREDIDGECRLLYEALDSLVGPGRILVASAGNDGNHNTYFRKEKGEASKGSFLLRWGKNDYFRIRTRDNLDMQFVVYDYSGTNDTLRLNTADILAQKDSLWTDTLKMCGVTFTFDICAYHSTLDSMLVYDYYVTSSELFGYDHPISFELIGNEAEAEFLLDKGDLITRSLNPALNAGDNTHSILSPGCAPRVICCGATAYRSSFTNAMDRRVVNDWGSNGERGRYSSIGPTLDGRTKPDVVAPGTNVLSAMSSYYLEAHPTDTSYTVAYSEYNGRRYPWASETGTSMSTPVVAGIIACWLQAQPDLSPEDILDIFSQTCTQREGYTYPNNEYGYGEIDAYKGLLKILNLSVIPSISQQQPQRARFQLQGNQLTILFQQPTAVAVHLTLYNLQGQPLQQHTITMGSTSHTITLPFPQGVYAVQLTSSDPTLQGSTLIRL